MSLSPENHNKSFKSISLIAIITSFSRILGLVREIVIAAFLGTTVYSDAFTIAFSIPNFFRRLFSEGILVSIFVPVFTSIRKQKGDQEAMVFAGRFFWIVSIILLCFCLTAAVFSTAIIEYCLAVGLTGETLDISSYLMRLMILYILLITLASIIQGVLNSFSVFWVSALTPVLLNVCVIVMALILSPLLDNPATGFAIGVLVGGVVQLIFQVPFARKLGLCFKIGDRLIDPEIKKLLLLAVPAVVGMGVYQINILIGNSIASTLEVGSISSLKFSSRLLELIIGIVVVSATTVLLPKFSELHVGGKLDRIREDLIKSMRLLAFVSIPLSAGGFLLSSEIVSLLFSRGRFDAQSIALTASAFRLHLIGLCFIAWNRVLLTGFQATGSTKRMVQSGIIIIGAHFLTAIWLSSFMGHEGVAAAMSISQILHSIILVLFLRELFSKSGFLNEMIKGTGTTVISTTIMLLFLIPIQLGLEKIALPEAAKLITLVILGGTVFFLASVMFKSREMKIILAFIKKNPDS